MQLVRAKAHQILLTLVRVTEIAEIAEIAETKYTGYSAPSVFWWRILLIEFWDVMLKYFLLMSLIFIANIRIGYAKNNLRDYADVVSAAEKYSWGKVGVPANSSKEELAAREIYKLGNAMQVYEMLDKANDEGKMYLLCILKKKNQEKYAKAVTAIKNKNELISVFSGDVLQKIPMSNVIKQISDHSCDPLDWPNY